MSVSLRYVLKETFANLLRNRMMAVAAVLTVGLSLSFVGASFLLKQAVATQVGEWSGNVNLQIFESANVTPGQHSAIASLVKTTPEISRCTYLDHYQSWLQMKVVLANDPTAVGALGVAQTPPDWRCTLANANDAETVAAQFQPILGVFEVEYPGASIRTMQQVTGIIQTILLVVALIVLVASLVLILTAIRMAIFARRREVGVMKLVGATNWFIRIPFMLEGLVQGLLGAVLAAATVLVGNVLFRDFIRRHVSALQQAVVPSHDLVLIEILILIAGSAVGAIGSFIAVHRFLDV
jgi:cell division transport system permease protein